MSSSCDSYEPFSKNDYDSFDDFVNNPSKGLLAGEFSLALYKTYAEQSNIERIKDLIILIISGHYSLGARNYVREKTVSHSVYLYTINLHPSTDEVIYILEEFSIALERSGQHKVKSLKFKDIIDKGYQLTVEFN
jgi:hypothetical protein